MKAERNVLAEVHNPHVVRLFYSFQARARSMLHAARDRELGPDRVAALSVLLLMQRVLKDRG